MPELICNMQSPNLAHTDNRTFRENIVFNKTLPMGSSTENKQTLYVIYTLQFCMMHYVENWYASSLEDVHSWDSAKTWLQSNYSSL